MVSFPSIELVKFIAFVFSGFTGARVWFSKEIRAGKVLLRHLERFAEQEALKAKTAVVEEIKAVEKKL